MRRFGHSEVYDLKDPPRALENVIHRFKESPTRSRHDDLVHVVNLIGSEAGGDLRLKILLDEAALLATSMPLKEARNG